jgi:hypothetical protein
LIDHITSFLLHAPVLTDGQICDSVGASQICYCLELLAFAAKVPLRSYIYRCETGSLFSRSRSRSLTELTRQITPPTKNGHAQPVGTPGQSIVVAQKTKPKPSAIPPELVWVEISAGFDLDLYFEKFARIARGYAVPEIEWVRRPAYRARCVSLNET